MASTSKTVYPIAENYQIYPAPPTCTDYRSHRGSPLILDNGQTHLRAGWATDDAPRLVTENIGARYRDRKNNETYLMAGTEAYIDASSRSSVRTAFEGDVVCNFDQMEHMLDYVFVKMGVKGSSVEHDIVMTEGLCNPQYSRKEMNELLFETYGVPSVGYGVDSLFAFANSNQPATPSAPFAADGMVVSSSTASTHVIPVLNGQAVHLAAKKLAWGGSQASEYLLKLMQLKYPTFPGRLSTFQANDLYKAHAYHAADYPRELGALADARTLAAADRTIQFPFLLATSTEASEEELARQLEKRKESGRRLQEQAAKQRLERMGKQEEELKVFGEVRESKATLSKADYEKRLAEYGFSSGEDLDQYLNKIDKSLTRARNKDLGIVEEDNKEEPTFPLVNVPDHTLNEADLKEKRRQRLMKAGYDARIRAKAERDEERIREAERVRRDAEFRASDPQGWLQSIRNEHNRLIERIRERKKLKEQLGDRKSLAAQNRMKNIANLANDDKPQKKRKRGQGEDDFGADDADWKVYKEIGGEDDDEAEDEEDELVKVEARLLEHDPSFTIDHTAARRALRKHQLLNAFVRGVSPDDPLDAYDPESAEHNAQLHLNIERVRVPEVMWQPQMGGLDQAGLGEMVEYVLRQFSQPERDRLTNNVFVTGSHTLAPGFDARLRNAVRPSLPVSSPLEIVRSAEPDASFAAWRGMAKWSRSAEAARGLVTRAEYDEFGAEYLKAHGLGNAA